jgi:hypothetical protein
MMVCGAALPFYGRAEDYIVLKHIVVKYKTVAGGFSLRL